MSQARILIAEDEVVVAEDLKGVVEGLGYEVVGIVPSGEEALAMARELEPDLALLDIVLKGKADGIGVGETLQSDLSVPVVYVTAHSDEATLRRAKATEPYGYVLKPFNDREIHAAIEIGLYKHQMEERLRHLNAVLRAIRNVNQLIVREKNIDRLLQGACDCLTEERGYDSAWIALRGGDARFTRFAESGIGEPFEAMKGALAEGKVPEALKTHENGPAVKLLEELPASCEPCPLFEHCRSRKVMVMSLRHGGRDFGVFSACVPSKVVVGHEEQSLFLEVAGDLAFALYAIEIDEQRARAEEELQEHRDQLEQRVRERTRELETVLHAMSGREIRMAGLKEVIRELREQLLAAGLTPVRDDPLLEEA